MKTKIYDVIVVGAGHAGCEASLASARMGCSTLLVTLHTDTIGFMSCNPAIGGVGKGQLVKEIDALGGEMAKAADRCAMQFRILNASKGPAVQSSRAQIDRKKYNLYMQKVVTEQKNLLVYETRVVNVIVKDNVIIGVQTDKGEKILGKAVVLTPGTFLNGLMHIGMKSFQGGRIEEQGGTGELSSSLRNLGFRILRFKTGTCARLDGKTIDFSKLRRQEGDIPPRPFSFSTEKVDIKQVPCYLTYTNDKTHSIIRESLSRSPLFNGKIIGRGVRYCPSLEDKVVKFPSHNRHQVFLEPEGKDTDEFYPNGLSTSLPEDVQLDFIHSVPGLENVKINRLGYGIEHNAVDSRQLYPTLEAKFIKNLYLAGQINGTTGYEEAAAQGLIAGANAALRIKNKKALIMLRDTSYIGVLLDDLTTKGTNEPYRMFTSRVEYRLTIREDNADMRLREIGYRIGLVSRQDYEKIIKKQSMIKEGLRYLGSKNLKPIEKLNNKLKENKIPLINKPVSLEEFLRRPQVTFKQMKVLDIHIPALPEDVINEIEIEVKYSGYIKKELSRIKQFKNIESIKIPESIDYSKIHSLSNEIIEKLSRIRPLSLGQASRISGVTPAAISILMIYLKKFSSELKSSRDKYYKFSSYLKKRFSSRVYKVSVDAGFSCPNKDGRLSRDGCIYCDNKGFSFNSRIQPRPLEQQIKDGMAFSRKRFKAEKFICYFQAYTNTYAPVNILKKKYDIIKKFNNIAGISIGTRPDCINEKILDLIESYTDNYDVWIEYGLQSIHKKTLRYINRGHTYKDFLNAVELTRRRKKIKICSHVIIGLPGETKDDIMETAKAVGALKLDGIKIHPLYVIKGTRLDDLYKQGIYKPMEMERYLDLASEFLEYLWHGTVVQRISADCPQEFLSAPLWIQDKHKVLDALEEKLTQEGRFQGRLYLDS